MLVFLEGTIAVGKTSVFESLKGRHPDWVFLPEPVTAWQNWNGENWLEKYYSNPKLHAYEFQKLVLESYKFLERDYQPSTVYIAERSPRVATHVFSRLCLSNGDINLEQYLSIVELFDTLFEFLDSLKPKTIYLRTTPEIVWGRMTARARPEEFSVTCDYLQKLCHYHDMEFCNPQNDFTIDESNGALSVAEKVQLVEELTLFF